MPPSTGTFRRLVGLITVLLVVLAIATVLALNSPPRQNRFTVKTVEDNYNFGPETKHIPPVVTTSTLPVLVRVQKVKNTLSVLFPTTTTTTVPVHRPVPAGHLTYVRPAPTSAITTVGIYNGYPCGGGLPNCCTLRKESGGNPTADNHQGYTGLWQFSHALWGNYHGYAEAKYAPWQLQNEKARFVVSQSGFRPWYGDGCYPQG